jgi:hypothetical protein
MLILVMMLLIGLFAGGWPTFTFFVKDGWPIQAVLWLEWGISLA